MILKLGRLAHQQRFWFAEGSATWQIRLYKPHFEKYFNNDVSQIDKQVKEIAKKYSLNKRGLERLFKLKPEVFITGSKDRAELQEKIKFLNKLEETQPLARLLNDLLFDSRHLLLQMTEGDILRFINNLKQYGFDQTSANNLLTSSSSLIHNKFDLLYKQKLSILKDYLHLTDKQAIQIFVHQPFLLTCSSNTLRESVTFFLQKCRHNKELNQQAIIKLLREVGEIFLIGRAQLTLLLNWYKGWGMEKEQLWKILLENPLLLLNHPGEIFHFKVKMFRQFRFTNTMGQLLLKKYPSALICSVRALQSKFLVARDRLKIKFDEKNLQFLTFKFGANLRPRSEMLIRGKVPYTSEDIVDYLSCSEDQFIKKTGIPKQKFQEQKFKFSITPELDFPQKKCLKNYPSEKKIFQLSEKYYAKEDLIIKTK